VKSTLEILIYAQLVHYLDNHCQKYTFNTKFSCCHQSLVCVGLHHLIIIDLENLTISITTFVPLSGNINEEMNSDV